MQLSRQVFSLFLLSCLGFLCGRAGLAYEYFDNVKEALVSGQRFLDQRKYREAQTDFENVLLMDPGNETAHLKLFRVYVALKKPELARRVVERLRQVGRVDAARLKSLEDELSPLPAPSEGEARDGSGVDLDRRMLEYLSPKGLDSGGSTVTFTALDTASGRTFGSEPPPEAREKSTSMDDILGAESALVDEPADSGGPGKKPLLAEGDDLGAEPSLDPLASSERKTPEDRFARSIELAKKKNFDSAIPLYVTAIQAKPSLMGMDDFGLMQLSRQAYLERVKKEPKNANLHFLVAFFHERFSDYDKAVDSYRKARDLCPPTSRLHLHARDKVVALEQRKEILAVQAKEDARKQAKKAAEAEVELIAQGKASTVKTAAEYHQRGTEHYQKWLGQRSKPDLRMARAFFEGAIVKEASNPEYHFRYAVLLIDEASLGDSAAKTKAQAELEQTLKLNPPDAFRKEAETLLKSLRVGS